jgi:replication factor C subunit 2/4
MEEFSEGTRFCFICKYVSRIIDPIASRCAKFRFKPLSEETMRARLRLIADGERIDMPDDALAALLTVADGDLRRAINLMQSASQLYGRTLTPASILETSGVRDLWAGWDVEVCGLGCLWHARRYLSPITVSTCFFE